MESQTPSQIKQTLKDRLVYYNPGLRQWDTDNQMAMYVEMPEFRQIIPGANTTRPISFEDAAKIAGISTQVLADALPKIGMDINERTPFLQQNITPQSSGGFFSNLIGMGLGTAGSVVGGLTNAYADPVAEALGVHPDVIKIAAAAMGMTEIPDLGILDTASGSFLSGNEAADLIASYGTDALVASNQMAAASALAAGTGDIAASSAIDDLIGADDFGNFADLGQLASVSGLDFGSQMAGPVFAGPARAAPAAIWEQFGEAASEAARPAFNARFFDPFESVATSDVLSTGAPAFQMPGYLQEGATNVVADLGNGTALVSDAAGNLSIVDAADVIDETALSKIANESLDLGLSDDLAIDAGQAIDTSGTTRAIDADGVTINRDVTLDADLPVDRGPSGQIDADGVKINRDVTLDADAVADSNVVNPIDADGVQINREVFQGDANAATLGDGSTTQVFDDGSSLTIDANGNISATEATDVLKSGATTQTFDDGSTLEIDADGNVSATDATDGVQRVQDVSADTSDGTVKTLNDGSTVQTFDDGSTLEIDVDGNVRATDATDLVTHTLQDATADTSEGTVQKLDDGSTIQTFDDGSTLAIDPNGNITVTNATDLISNVLNNVLPNGDNVPIEDRTTLFKSVTDKPLSESLLDLGGGVLEFVTANPLTTAAVLVGGTALLGGEGREEIDPEPPPKKTYTYQQAPKLKEVEALLPTWSAASQIYGPQEMYKAPLPTVPAVQPMEFGALLSGHAPGGRGLGYLAKTLNAPQAVDINKLTPDQLAILQQMVGVA